MHFALAALLLAAPVPPEAAPQTHANLPLVVTGTIVGGIAYGLPLGTAAVYSVLVVPLIALGAPDRRGGFAALRRSGRRRLGPELLAGMAASR